MLLFLDEEAGDPRELVGELMRLLLPSEACGEVVGLTAPLLPVVLDPRRAADKMLVDRLDPEPAKSTNETDQPVESRRNPPNNRTDQPEVSLRNPPNNHTDQQEVSRGNPPNNHTDPPEVSRRNPPNNHTDQPEASLRNPPNNHTDPPDV